MLSTKAKYLFEVSWEVCNKVGGIYTVVKSKAQQMVKHYKEFYFLIGPYFDNKSMREFQPEVPDEKLNKVFEKLKNKKIIAYYGKWLIKGKPKTILIDFSKFFEKKNDIKKQMWEGYEIDSLNSPYDYDEPVVWANAVARFLEEFSHVFEGEKVAHFHEWLSGAALLYIKKKNIKIGTVFTTHATMLGRTLAGNNVDLYSIKNNKCILELMNIEREAHNYNITAKHQLEKATAQYADVFTTVSEITGLETEHILKRKPDILIPNGLDFSELPNLEEIPIKHKVYKAKVREFIISYFFPYYPLDIENTLFYFIAGRYEFKNKGIDVTIKALALLNEKLKKEKSKKTIVVFFFIPANIKKMNLSVIESKALFEDIEDSVDDNLKEIRERIIYGLAQQKLPTKTKIFDEDFLLELRNKILSFKKEGYPPLSTHELVDEQNDLILKSFRESKLSNKKTDNVKVVFYPYYLSASDGLLDLNYYSAIWGCHLGIFASYYEPWGYTPLECAAYGVPSITTDLAGFGKFVLANSKEEPGIFVIKRQGKKEEFVVKKLADRLYRYTTLPKNDRIKCKIKAEHFAPLCDWGKLVVNYIKAHNMALEKITK